MFSNNLINHNSLMSVINISAKEMLENKIVQSMTIIDWGKAMARCNEIIQTDLLRYCGIDAYDPELDDKCPYIDTTNNSPGFDIVVRNPNDGKLLRIQSKLRQVQGMTDYSRQVHFETTRRHSQKNQGASSHTGHVAYSTDEFDYVMVSLINVKLDTSKRNNIDEWSFSIIPIHELINQERGCCVTTISSELLYKYKYVIDPNNPPQIGAL